jgi:hypothetical protein
MSIYHLFRKHQKSPPKSHQEGAIRLFFTRINCFCFCPLYFIIRFRKINKIMLYFFISTLHPLSIEVPHYKKDTWLVLFNQKQILQTNSSIYLSKKSKKVLLSSLTSLLFVGPLCASLPISSILIRLSFYFVDARLFPIKPNPNPDSLTPTWPSYLTLTL